MEVKVQKKFYIQLVERKKRDLMFLQCITKLMVHLDQENRNTGIMFGRFHKLNIDLDMLKKNYLWELDYLYIQKELMEFFQKL